MQDRSLKGRMKLQRFDVRRTGSPIVLSETLQSRLQFEELDFERVRRGPFFILHVPLFL